MGTIIERKRKDGSSAYLAQIMIRREGKIVHREARTFERRQAAAAWLERRESELLAPGGLAKAAIGDPTLGDAINRYVEESTRPLGRTKSQVLRSIGKLDIASKPCSTITSATVVAFARSLSGERKPQTVQNYLSHLGAVVAVAKAAWDYPLDPSIMRDAFIVAKRLGITARSASRDRRPSIDEMRRIMEHYADRQKRQPYILPMSKIIPFALFSTRRMEEITRIEWSDLDEGGSRVLVRDMKSPGEKIGNNVWCDLPPEALQIALSMPRSSERIFPYTTDAIGASFTRSVALLGIDDLHFHDLRHEGVSRLFELGWNIPRVATVSGHKSWTSLKRYTHIRQTGDKWACASFLHNAALDPF